MHHDYEAIVTEALNAPGKLSERSSAFWNFSLGNQWYAMVQLGRAEPISTFPGWEAVGRYVKRGEKAIELLMTVFKKAKDEVTGQRKGWPAGNFHAAKKLVCTSSNRGGRIYSVIPHFDIDRALCELKITKEDFSCADGNCQGYALPESRVLAVSPIAYDGLKTTFHEASHILLGHGRTNAHGERKLPKDVRETEAELVSYLCKASLGLTDNLEYSRGYIAHWRDDNTVEKIRYSTVFTVADQILKAGRIEPERPGTQPLDTPQSTLEGHSI